MWTCRYGKSRKAGKEFRSMSGGRKKVLWVDDEIEYLRSHIMFLETRGYSVVPVFCGDDAVQIIQQNPKEFDIVLLDEQMPGKDGLTTLEEIKDFAPDLPVVMVTKSEEEQLMEDALGKKIDGYLTKPVNPSQILLVCKKLLDSRQLITSQISQRFIRSYSQNRTALSGHLKVNDWIRMYENLVNWDFELEKADDEGLRQTQAGQKSDFNAAFSDFVIDNYARWVKGKGDPPVMSHQVLEELVFPLIADGKKTVMLVLSGMRLDQYICMEQILKKYFNTRRQYFYSILPSSSFFSRSAFFAGALPLEIAAEHDWYGCKEPEKVTEKAEKCLLQERLEKAGFQVDKKEPWFTRLPDRISAEELLSKIDSCVSSGLVVFVVDFFDVLLQNSPSSSILQEITNDESGLRTLTGSWFRLSALLQTLRELSRRDCRIILTSDHGSTFCSRGTELYGAREWGKHLRYKFGREISCDERTVVFLDNPEHFGIPRFAEDNNCIIAKENFYFIHPEKFEHYQRQYRNTFQQGGISLQELIMPLGVFEAL